MQSELINTLRPLADRVAAITESPENQRRIAHWQRYRAGVPASKDNDGPLFTLDIGMPTWSRILGFDLIRYFTDVGTQLRVQLEMRIYHHEHFAEDTVVGTGLGASPLGTVFECSLLGAEIEYRPDSNPWAAHNRALVEDDADLDRLELPDFYNTGAMPLAHRMYQEALEAADALGPGWQVGFPAAIRGILGLAQVMRGPHENILTDMLLRPEFAKRLFSYATDFRMHYARERARFLDEPIDKGHIGNDEVTVPTVSPQLYKEFLLPREIELSEFHGGLTCWHSCGDTGPLLPLIRRIPNVDQFYTGPWTDLEAVMATFGQDTPLDIAIHVVDDMLAATPQRMEEKLRRVMSVCGDAPLRIRAGSTDSAFGLQTDLAQMRRWTEAAQRLYRQ